MARLIWDWATPSPASRPSSSKPIEKLRPVGEVAALEVGSAEMWGSNGTWLQAVRLSGESSGGAWTPFGADCSGQETPSKPAAKGAAQSVGRVRKAGGFSCGVFSQGGALP